LIDTLLICPSGTLERRREAVGIWQWVREARKLGSAEVKKLKWILTAILILNFFATDLHGLSQIFTEGYLLFCFIVNLLNPSGVFPCSSVAKIRIAGILIKHLK
jgi:hypothetical protein